MFCPSQPFQLFSFALIAQSGRALFLSFTTVYPVWFSLRVCRKFPQLHSDELLLGQRLPGRRQRLPQWPEHEQGRAEAAALLPRCRGEERQSRGPGCSPGTANALLLLLAAGLIEFDLFLTF